jgi:chromosome segregation ATPase
MNPLQRAQEASRVTTAARKSIGAILQTQTPWGGTQPNLSTAQVDELEKSLRALESKVGEQEMALVEAQNKLADRERALAEAEALLQAREKLIEAMRHDKEAAVAARGAAAVSPEEVTALQKLKEALDQQEASLKEQRAVIKEREDFLEQSEAALFDKMQAQQEKETELEQKAEDVKRAMLRAGLIKPEAPPPMEKA